ncbi:MAG TPA: hypothetical protein DEA38_12035 [Stenotrophomonas sp.]|nr:hypothetical protein [Stenotrophomonas sp.]
MSGKKKLISSIASVVVVAAMALGAGQAFATSPKTGLAPGCEEHPACPYGNGGKWGLLACCDPR